MNRADAVNVAGTEYEEAEPGPWEVPAQVGYLGGRSVQARKSPAVSRRAFLIEGQLSL
jgi:hypothetical protein